MTTYYNLTTNQTAQVNSEKADKDGNVWVEIDGAMPRLMNWQEFIRDFNSIAVSTSSSTISRNLKCR